MRIIAFSGKKQSGKTTAVKDMESRNLRNGSRVDFADSLKFLVLTYFAEPVSDEDVGYVQDFDKEEIKTKLHPCGLTYRQILQKVGTDWFRDTWPDIWIEKYKREIERYSPNRLIITSDVRFPNEVKCVQDLGGHVIRLLRNPHDDQHESETALDRTEARGYDIAAMRDCLTFDAIIDNREMSVDEQNEKIWELVNERKWL